MERCRCARWGRKHVEYTQEGGGGVDCGVPCFRHEGAGMEECGEGEMGEDEREEFGGCEDGVWEGGGGWHFFEVGIKGMRRRREGEEVIFEG